MRANSEGLIGIVTTVQPKFRTRQQTIVNRPSLHYCRMAEVAAQEGFGVALFAPSNVSWGKQTVRAWVPAIADRPYGTWKQQLTRLPDVIYENVFVHLAMKGYARELRMAARSRGIPVFNPPLPGKWRLHRILMQTSLKQYLPSTEVLKNIAHAVGRTNQWKLTYIKPIGGYGGAGVNRVQLIGANRYRVAWDRTASGGVTPSRQEMSSEQLQRWLAQKTQVPHLIQQGIHLLKLQGRKIDFRAVAHRDKSGSWKMVGLVPKLAARDGVVTNLVAGGERRSMPQVIQLAKLENKEIPVERLEQCALDIATYISQKHPLVGLVGFDLGVDESGRVWMIEMNPKPARSLLDDEMRLASARYSAEFAGYLARQRRR